LGTLLTLSACAPFSTFAVVPRTSGTEVSQGAATQALLYVSNPGTDAVRIYSFPAAVRVGALANLNEPEGLCTDNAQDIWVVESGAGTVVKYPHGGTSPILSRTVYGAFNLLGCAVDKGTGNLAVTAIGNSSGGAGVWVFSPGRKSPRKHGNPGLRAAYFCAYDSSGNLFVDGLNASYAFVFFELPKGEQSLRRITVNRKVGFPGGVGWDGHHVALGDSAYQNRHEGIVYRMTVSGSSGKVEGTTILGRSCDVLQFGLSSGTLIAPDDCENDARLYAFPGGGDPKKTLTGLAYPVAAVVST
jgi:hypothetical protein